LVREVFNEAQRAALVAQVSGALAGVRGEVRERAFGYWKSVDRAVGENIESAVRAAR